MDGERTSANECPGCVRLRAEVEQFKAVIVQQAEQIAQQAEHIERLTGMLEQLTRDGKRQAAPFSKGPPAAKPKKPGRKSGKDHGRHCRLLPPDDDRIDEHHTATLPECCPHCGTDDILKRPETSVQHQVELPTRPIWRKFTIERGTCRNCRKPVSGTHPLQTSQAVGAAGVMLGATAQAAAALLNKTCGLAWGKVSRVFKELFGISLSRGGACRTMLRVAKKAEPLAERAVAQIRGSPRVRLDETGWRVGGRLVWAHAIVGDEATCYRIRPSRGAEVAADVLGWDYAGTLLHDGWAAYDRFEQATHAQCVQHALRRAHLLLDAAPTAGAARFPRRVLDALKAALTARARLKERGSREGSPARRRAYDERTEHLARAIVHRQRLPENERFAAHLRKHLFEWLQSLLDPGLEAANWPAEQALRPLVVNRKVWGGNRTWTGARAQEILSTLLETCRRQSQHPIALLTHSLLLPPAKPQVVTGR